MYSIVLLISLKYTNTNKLQLENKEFGNIYVMREILALQNKEGAPVRNNKKHSGAKQPTSSRDRTLLRVAGAGHS